MSREDFQLLDNEATVNSIMKRDILKIYHHQAANINDSDQNIQFIFGENNNYHIIGNAYLRYEMTLEKDVFAANRVVVDGNSFRLVNTDSANCFKEATLSAPGGSSKKYNNYCGQFSTIMRALTSKDGDLLSQFDKIDESRDEIGNTSLKHHLINNHDVAATKQIKGHLPLEHIFGFRRLYKKST